jgi:hypothetical protein
MVSKKPTLLVLIGTILIAWILISSIHPIQPVVNAGGSTSAQTSQNTQQASRRGGSLGNLSLFRLPSLNFHFPNLFNFNWPNFNLTLTNFNFKWPTINWPNFGFGSGSGSGQGSGSGSGSCESQGTCQNGSGAGGSGSGSGNSGSGQNGGSAQAQSTTRQQQPVFTIPKDLLIAIVIIVLIVAGTLLVLRSRNAITNRTKKSSQQSLIEPFEPLIAPAENPSKPPESFALQFEPDEKIADYEGWGTQTGFLRPKIDQSLPLIWSLDEPLELEAPAGSTVYLGKDRVVEMSASKDENATGVVSFSEPGNVVHASHNDMIDVKWIRAVHYNDDVMKHFRLNFLITSQEEKELGVMTPREIVKKIITEKPDLVKDKTGLLSLARMFERAFYGKKKISRDEYELFLHSLSKSLANPKVIICGPKDSN